MAAYHPDLTGDSSQGVSLVRTESVPSILYPMQERCAAVLHGELATRQAGIAPTEQPFFPLRPERRSPQKGTLVDGLKQAIPYSARAWESDRKLWVIWPLYATELETYLRQVGAQVQDDRTGAQAPVAVPPMPEDLRRAFATLHLASTAPLGAAEAVYRFWSKHTHPDLGGDVTVFHGVNDAIQVIRHYLDPKDTPDDDLPF